MQDEYVGDMFRGDGDEGTEPDWVKAEREAFADQRDENGDGFMDSEEVKKWILPGISFFYQSLILLNYIFFTSMQIFVEFHRVAGEIQQIPIHTKKNLFKGFLVIFYDLVR